ncbi:MAG TPA: C25 family cysteine peptidase [Candidatus Kapabacteria bacterium]|nr:C25 family cysteine peptidase [Candidatus Kapabacteria bacterium]
MIFRRTIPILLAALLLVSSRGFGFQVSKSAVKSPLRPAVMPAFHSISPATSKKKLSHALVSSRVRFPNRRGTAKSPIVKRFTFGSAHPTIVRSHQTSVSTNSGSITLTVDIGQPAVTQSKVAVKNAPPAMAFSDVTWPLLAASLPNGFTLISSQGGSPEYPLLTVTFAIPAGASNITPFVKTTRTSPVGNIHFAPSEQEIKGVAERVYDSKLYATTPKVTILKPETFRSLRMVTVSVPLVSDGPQGMEALRQFSVGIRFTSNGTQSQGVLRDPVFADMNARLVANPYDLAQFAVALRPTRTKPRLSGKGAHALSSTSFDSVYSWIDTNAPYIRLAVTRDGLYRVAASELNFDTLGFTLASSGWTPHNLRCINHGKEVPIWIDTDSSGGIAAIEFYGQHLRGFPLPIVTFAEADDTERPLPEYYNVATDTNVYWLTASSVTGGSPLRYTPKMLAPSGAPIVSAGNVLLHHEQDHNYYLGDAFEGGTVPTQEATEYVPGERFEWYELHGLLDNAPNPHFIDTFYIAKLPADTAGKVANFKFLLRGMNWDQTIQGSTVHVVQAQINNSALSSPSFFDNFSYDSLKMSVPLSQLVQGANIVRVNALTDNVKHTDIFYLDYYEVSFESGLAPSIDTAVAKGQWLFSAAPNSGVFQIALTDPSAHLYNLTDTTRVIPQSGIFADLTGSPQPLYAAATLGTMLRCDNIQPWNTPKTLGWNILSNQQRQADYLIITAPEFLRAAGELATSRSGLGLHSMIVTTNEVFNAFDYGSNEPAAIRRFLNYAYLNYPGIPVSLVTLLGDASWDPKFNLGRTKHSFVPTYGDPVSDVYFTLAEDSNLDSQPLMMISRIPVASETNADSYIQKLVEYEGNPPAAWNRRFLFLAGGNQGSEHDEFHAEAVRYLYPHSFPLDTGNLGLILPPTNIQGTIIDRTDFTSGVDATHVGEIEDALQTGQSIMYFAGHGATFTSDILFPDASVLHNQGLYPLLITLTCRTGAFAEPDQVGVNESYVLATEAGSVQAYGTTGFGEPTLDDILTNKYFQWMQAYDTTHDTTRPGSMNELEMLTAAKLYASPFSYNGHNEELQLSMLGDAATGFVLRPQPEFAVYANEVHAYAASDTVRRTSLSVSDSSMTIRALIHNYGYSADRPVVVRMTDNGPTGLPLSVDDSLPRLDTSAIASARFPLTTQSIGTHQISVVIDPDRTFPESYRPDDSTSIQVRVNGLSTTPFYPYEGSRAFCDISTSAVHFIVLTPAGTSPNDQVELELDTTDQFSNILLDQKKSIGASYYVTFDVPIPPAPKPWSSVYWWRSRVVRANGDATDWQYATFSTASAPRSEFSYTSPEQLDTTIINGLALNARGFLYLPNQDTLHIEAISHGPDDSDLHLSFTPYAQVNVNGIQLYETAGFEGYDLLIWTPDGTQISQVAEFEMPWPIFLNGPNAQHLQDSAAAVFDSVLQGIPVSRRVTVLTLGQVDYPNFIDSTKAQMQTLGSANGLTPPYNGSYALIGVKGSAPGSAKEGNAPDQSGHGTHVFDTVITSGASGLAETPFTAVAKDYGTLAWTGDPIPSGSDITFTVLGARRDGSGIDVVDTFDASKGQSFDISKIDPRVYDQLGVKMNFIRSSNATQSPALSGVELQYDAAPELIFTADSIQTIPNLTNSGGIVMANYGISTLTCTPADSIPLLLVRQYQGKTDTIQPIHYLTQLAGHTSVTFSDSVQTTNELGTAALTATVNPNEVQNEQLLFNNTIAGSYTVTRDTMKPTIQILFDDRNIPDGGYVSANTTIQINLLSSNLLRDTSHSSILAVTLTNFNTDVVLSNISYYNYSGFAQPEFSALPSGPVQAFLRFKSKTPYPAGQWVITAAVTDASGNTDTLKQNFTISNVNGIEEVMNYPNPFKDKTDFTFVLKSDGAADMKIIVYTIAGRKIRTLIPTDLHAGFNMIEWDGRDDNGNEVADGTYLYRVIINGKNGDNVSDAVTERAVRDR